MRVAFVTVDWGNLPSGKKTPGGSGYYRCVLPAQAMSEFGGLETACFADAAQTKSGEIVPLNDGLPDPGWDVIVLQRWMQPEVARVTARARATGQVIVQDVDDHWWALDRANVASKYVSQEWWNVESYSKALRAATYVTASTPFLAEVIKDLGQPNVHVLRNMIDLRLWTRQDVRDDLRTIGWVGSTSHRSGDLETLESALKRFLRNHPDVTFVHGGKTLRGPSAGKALRLPVSRTETRPIVPIHRYPALWKGIDVALCPLSAVDFNRAKSAIKAMEASASGVPFIASDLDEYRWYAQGLTASTERQWEEGLEEMTDPQVRRETADRAFQRVQEEDVSRRFADWLSPSGAVV